jgi:hypothetical protein
MPATLDEMRARIARTIEVRRYEPSGAAACQ